MITNLNFFKKIIVLFAVFVVGASFSPDLKVLAQGNNCTETEWDCDIVDLNCSSGDNFPPVECGSYRCRWETRRVGDCGGGGGGGAIADIRYRVRFDANHDGEMQNYDYDIVDGVRVAGDPAVTWSRAPGPFCNSTNQYDLANYPGSFLHLYRSRPTQDPLLFDPSTPGYSYIRYPNDCGTLTREGMSRSTINIGGSNVGILVPTNYYIRSFSFGRSGSGAPFCTPYESSITNLWQQAFFCNDIPPGRSNWVTFLISDQPPPPEDSVCVVSSNIISDALNPYEIAEGASLDIFTNFTSVEPPGVPAQIVYTLVTPGVISTSSPLTVNVPNPAGATAVGNYASSINVEGNVGAGGLSTEVRADVIIDGSVACTTSSFIQILEPAIPPWWQVVGGDFVAASGDIRSEVYPEQPPLRKMIATDNWGMPILTGDILQPSSSTNLGTPAWISRTSFTATSDPKGVNYNYAYFAQKFMPSDNLGATITNADYFRTIVGTNHDGYQTYKRTGDLTISGDLDFTQPAIGTKKVIVFVDGVLKIDGKILLDDGKDFIMFVATGDILVNPLVGDAGETYTTSTPDLEGVFITDSVFRTGHDEANPAGDPQLHVRGMVHGWGNLGTLNGVEFQRDLQGDNEFPAERFQFAPDLLLLFPSFFAEKSITWKEVSP